MRKSEENMNSVVRNSRMKVVVVFAMTVAIAVVIMLLGASVAGAASNGFAPAPGGTHLYSWGNNSNGQLGQGDYGDGTERLVPTRVGGADNWVMVSAGAGAIALNAKGELYSWGAAWDTAQMGQGDNPDNPGAGNITVPTRVGNEDNWVYVRASGPYATAINDLGHLYVWGGVDTSITGVGSIGAVDIPTRVGSRSDWVKASLDQNIGAALTAEGHVYTWGRNYQGELGRGDFGGAYRLAPQRMEFGDNWTVIATHTRGIAAINADGELYAWGINFFGQLGLGDYSNRNIPTRVGSASNWVDVIDYGSARIALNSDGEIFTWGNPGLGRLGRAVTAANPQYLPGRVGDRSDWVAIGVSNGHGLALTIGMELYAWGNNNNGQLGIGTIGGYETTPQFVLQAYGFAGFSQSGGGSYSLALIRTEPITPELFLTKNLQKPTNTPVPNLTFSFTFTPHSFNDNTTNLTPLPTIPTRTVTVNNTHTSAPNSPSAGITTTSNSVDILEDITFTQAGIYAWTIAEVQSATGIGSNSEVIFSQATYRLRVYVTQAALGSPLEVYAITIHRLTDSAGNTITPPYKTNTLAFTNTYMRTTTGVPPYSGAVTVSKTVIGNFANLNTPFDFEVTLTRTALCSDTTNFVGRVMQGNTQIGADIDFVSGTTRTVALTHSQRLVFDELVVGTQFSVTELATPEFIASVELFVNGTSVHVAPNTTPHTDLPIGEHRVGVQSNTAHFTNAHNMVPPTGLNITDNTSVRLAILATIATLTIITLKARRRVEELTYT